MYIAVITTQQDLLKTLVYLLHGSSRTSNEALRLLLGRLQPNVVLKTQIRLLAPSQFTTLFTKTGTTLGFITTLTYSFKNRHDGLQYNSNLSENTSTTIGLERTHTTWEKHGHGDYWMNTT